MNYNFPINGLRHHDFKGRLDELYELAPGRRMSISIERDNPQELNAVIVYWGKNFVGYVRSGSDREQAYSIIKASGRGSLLGKITGVDREKRWLWMEITTQEETPVKVENTNTLLTNWNFDGELLPSDEAELRLHTLLSNLEMTVESLDPWDDDMEQWLEYIEQNLWRDISLETSLQMSHVLDLLTHGCQVHPEYKQKVDRLQMTVDVMGSPEVRKLQAMQILQKADSKEMDLLLLHYGDKAKVNMQKLPEAWMRLFLEDGECFMARLWYLHRPYKQIQALKTLLALMVRLKHTSPEKPSTAIPEHWLLAWGTRQKDKMKAEVIKDVISSYELEKSNPQLAEQIQQVIDGCNPEIQQTNAINKQTEALKAIASQPTTQINQLNMGDGTQQLPPNTTLPQLPES